MTSAGPTFNFCLTSGRFVDVSLDLAMEPTAKTGRWSVVATCREP